MALTGSDICKILLAIFIPPLGVFLERGCGADFLINILLTILGYMYVFIIFPIALVFDLYFFFLGIQTWHHPRIIYHPQILRPNQTLRFLCPYVSRTNLIATTVVACK
ncbi:hypothetical protein EDB85DRAFT_919978 [Lactarius pseudohatsudake]|nr:hypothetical protein EDB85DRAFT_919978 [Lactarius pseudohatsudake]